MTQGGENAVRGGVGGSRRSAFGGAWGWFRTPAGRGNGSLYLQWAGHALHSRFFGQGGRQRFGRRGRIKG